MQKMMRGKEGVLSLAQVRDGSWGEGGINGGQTRQSKHVREQESESGRKRAGERVPERENSFLKRKKEKGYSAL